MKVIAHLAPHYFIVVAREIDTQSLAAGNRTFGDLWTVGYQKRGRNDRAAIIPLPLETAEDCLRYTEAQARELVRLLHEQDDSWWNEPLKDPVKGQPIVVLDKRTVQILKVDATLTTV